MLKLPFLLGVGLMITSCDPGCENEVSADLPSPNGKQRVILFSRNCGATTGFNTQATLLGKGEKLDDEGGNVFIIDQGNAKVSWKNDDGILVTFGPGVRVFKKEISVKGIEIEYRAE